MQNSQHSTPPRALGFWMCTALVVGNTIGMGIFVLPASLAPYGFNAITGWLVTLVGFLFGNAALLFLLGVGLRALLRSERAVRWAQKRFPARAVLLERFRAAALPGDLFVFRPALFLALAMTCQVLQMKVLAGGSSGTFESIAPVTNVDAGGVERADVHALALRVP